jgi:acetyl-CoA carboxylase carboxyl transferase subunit alpha
VERPDGRTEGCEALKITGKDLLDLGLIDEIVPEPLGGAHNAPAASSDLKESLVSTLNS